MFDNPVLRSRPVRDWDGEGVAETYNPDDVLTIFVDVLMHEGRQAIAVPIDEDVRVGDWIVAPYDLFSDG